MGTDIDTHTKKKSVTPPQCVRPGKPGYHTTTTTNNNMRCEGTVFCAFHTALCGEKRPKSVSLPIVILSLRITLVYLNRTSLFDQLQSTMRCAGTICYGFFYIVWRGVKWLIICSPHPHQLLSAVPAPIGEYWNTLRMLNSWWWTVVYWIYWLVVVIPNIYCYPRNAGVS